MSAHPTGSTKAARAPIGPDWYCGKPPCKKMQTRVGLRSARSSSGQAQAKKGAKLLFVYLGIADLARALAITLDGYQLV